MGGVVGVGECLLCGALCSGVVGGAEVVECGEAEAGEVAECAVDAGDGEVAVESGEVDGEAVVAGVGGECSAECGEDTGGGGDVAGG